MGFEYKRYLLPDGETIGRPVIPILIRNPRNNEAIEYEALVDSGADRRVFPSEIGEMLGIDIGAGEQQYVSGVIEGERRPMYFHPVEITPGGYSASRILRLVAGFMPDLSDCGHGLLGQNGFLDDVSFVKFRTRTGILELGSRWR
jgi:hypothetical protein